MPEILNIILNGVGIAILWGIGMIVVPLLVTIIHGFLTDFDDENLAQIVFWITFILCWILSGIFLILI